MRLRRPTIASAVAVLGLSLTVAARSRCGCGRTERVAGVDDGRCIGGRSCGPKEVFMARVMADCRRWPSDLNCSLTIIGEEEEVVRAAVEHAASVHGHEDTPEMRQQLREFLEPAEAYTNEPRTQEPLPG
jgi:predicted small metal-binding protein